MGLETRYLGLAPLKTEGRRVAYDTSSGHELIVASECRFFPKTGITACLLMLTDGPPVLGICKGKGKQARKAARNEASLKLMDVKAVLVKQGRSQDDATRWA